MMATEKKRPATADHANLPYEKWNATTVKFFLADETQRRFNVDYAPGGRARRRSDTPQKPALLRQRSANTARR